ncbi:MAG: DUF4143 domain-containing protein, partial [Thermoanaerobaculia bacterium]|nr:DUF4143 domain-containing protein [Thermoanaerobaculia bacterium]
FWRTLQQQEIDYVEETYEGVRAYEFKWNEKAKVRFPETFVKSYKPLSLKSVNRQNFEEFLIPERFGSQL